jgi:hypothetical protein
MPINIFDALFRQHINSSNTDLDLLKRCLKAASTVREAIQVFNAVAGPDKESYIDGFPTLVLKHMIKLVQDFEEAELVYSFASIKRRRSGKPMYPAVKKQAEAKLKSLK